MNYLTKNKAWEINEDYDKEKLLYLLIDRPNEINEVNEYIWHIEECKPCRNYDLPSVVSEFGSFCWFIDKNILHRKKHKPAVIFFDGYKQYYENGNFIKI